jgi:hypothetical protein
MKSRSNLVLAVGPSLATTRRAATRSAPAGVWRWNVGRLRSGGFAGVPVYSVRRASCVHGVARGRRAEWSAAAPDAFAGRMPAFKQRRLDAALSPGAPAGANRFALVLALLRRRLAAEVPATQLRASASGTGCGARTPGLTGARPERWLWRSDRFPQPEGSGSTDSTIGAPQLPALLQRAVPRQQGAPPSSRFGPRV